MEAVFSNGIIGTIIAETIILSLVGLICNEKIVLSNYTERILFAGIYSIITAVFIID